MNVNRLSKLVKTLRNAPKEKAKHFTMATYVHDGSDQTHPCGTPACALGWYATTRQTAFRIIPKEGYLCSLDGVVTDHRGNIGIAATHFGIEVDEAYELFDGAGCGDAKTTKQAANYIENFIVKKLRKELKSSTTTI